MLPVHVTHREYQDRLRASIVGLAAESPNLRKDVEASADVIGLCYAMDLDRAAPILRANYARGGPLAIDPAVMLRAILIMCYRMIPGFTALVDELKRSSVLRVVIGCEEPPGPSTFYDFLGRLPGFRAMARRTVKRRIRKRRPKRKYPKGKKPPLRRANAMQFLEHLRYAELIPEAEELVKTMNYLLDKGFVSLSLERGLIGDPLGLAAAGDSSSVELHASPYGKRTPECDCPPATGLSCPHRRRYSAPDADWNWESSKAEWVFGYRFYEFTAARGEELPLCIGMPTKPQQNDAISGYVCLLQYHRLVGRPLRMVLFDSAHDNEPTYRLVRDLGAIPVIDLNSGNTGSGEDQPKPIKSTAQIGLGGIDARGTPHCAAGPMCWQGHTGGYQRFVCPAPHKGLHCPHAASCPRRSVHLKPEMSPRFICEIPRATQAWEKTYDRRTTVERSHDRKKNDFGREAGYSRARHVVYALYVLAGCLQHIIAWAKRINGQALLAAWLPQAA